MAHQGGPGTGSLGGPPSGHVRDIFSYGARVVVACSALSIRVLLYPHWALAERARVPRRAAGQNLECAGPVAAASRAAAAPAGVQLPRGPASMLWQMHRPHAAEGPAGAYPPRAQSTSFLTHARPSANSNVNCQLGLLRGDPRLPSPPPLPPGASALIWKGTSGHPPSRLDD